MRVNRNRVRSWWALGFGEKLELLAVVILACAAEVAVPLVPLPRLASLLGIALIDPDHPNDELRQTSSSRDRGMIAKRARIVDLLYRQWPRKRSCLRRALVLGYRIRKSRPTLLIGVAREEGGIRAHAWIEVGGNVVGEQSGDWAPLRSQQTAG